MVGEGIPESKVVVKSKGGVSEKMMVALICCLMVTMASGQPDREAVRIPIDGDMAGMWMVLLMILGALVVWEGVKWGCECVQIYHEYLPGAIQRKIRRLQRIRDATALAIQRELERTTTAGGREASEDLQPSIAIHGREPRQPSTIEITRAQLSQPSTTTSLGAEVVTSPHARRNQPWESPGIVGSSGIDFSPRREGQFEDDRVCQDVLQLLTVEHLREGLRHEGLMTSGVKQDLTRRLADCLTTCVGISPGPTLRQLKFVLWIWRHGNVSGRYQLRWADINKRTRISAFIHAWKDQ